MGAFRIKLALLLAVLYMGCGARTDGPIHRTAGTNVEIPAQSTPVTWGMPIETVSGPVTIRRIDLIGVSGLKILGVSTCEGSPLVDGSYLNCAPTGDAWPPVGVAVREVDGTVIDSAPDKQAGLLVGAQLEPGVSTGSVQGVRFSYSYAGADYQVDQPWSLELKAR